MKLNFKGYRMDIGKKIAVQLLVFSCFTTGILYGDQGNPVRNVLIGIEKNYTQKMNNTSIKQKNQRKISGTC